MSDTQIDAISDRRNAKLDMVVAVAASALAVAAVYGLPATLLPFDFFAGQTIGHVCFWIAQCGLTCKLAGGWHVVAFNHFSLVCRGWQISAGRRFSICR